MSHVSDIFFSNMNAVYRDGGFYYAPLGTDWHRNDYSFEQNIFYYIVEGSCSITIQDKTYKGKPSDWFFIPSNTRFSYYNFSDKPFAKYWVQFDLYPQLTPDSIDGISHCIRCGDHANIVSEFKTLADICESGKSSDILETKSLILKLLATYLRSSGEKNEASLSKSKRAFETLLAYINENLSNPLPNKELAAQLHMHTNHFIRHFKERMGQPPQQYIMEKRLESAKLLLEQDDLSLAAIAEATGFCDSSHLSKRFRSYYSISPGRYQKHMTTNDR